MHHGMGEAVPENPDLFCIMYLSLVDPSIHHDLPLLTVCSIITSQSPPSPMDKNFNSITNTIVIGFDLFMGFVGSKKRLIL